MLFTHFYILQFSISIWYMSKTFISLYKMRTTFITFITMMLPFSYIHLCIKMVESIPSIFLNKFVLKGLILYVVPHSVPSCCTQYIYVFSIIYNPLCHVLHCCMLNSGVVLVMGLQGCTCPFGLSCLSVVDYNSLKYNYFGTLVLALAHGLQLIYLAWPQCFSASYLVHPAFCVLP